MQIPIGLEEHFKGVVDLITMKAFVWSNEEKGAKYDILEIPADLLDAAKEAREKLVEAVSAIDDDLMMKYLEGEEISETEIRKALRAGTLAMKIVPVFTGSAFKNKGVQTLLDAVVDFLPSPLDIPAIEGTNPKSGEIESRPPDAKAPFSAWSSN